MTTEGFAPAKVNLTLHVTGQRSDGYHLLDSLVVFANVGDRLWFEPRREMSMEITGPFAQGVPADARNLAWRAVVAAQVTGHITLEKNLPHGAGLGGGSADAAAALRILFGDCLTDGIGLDGALALGADVPVCMCAEPQRMQEIGEKLTRVRPMPQCDIVLVNPRVTVPTRDVFDRLRSKENPAMGQLEGCSDLDMLVSWLHNQRNDLEVPARAVAPVIDHVLGALEDAALARMSGSGSTCFGIYPDPASADRAASRIQAEHPEWWVVSAQTAGRSLS